MSAHSSILAWKIPWTEKPGRLQSMGSQRVGYDWATNSYLRGSGIRRSGFFSSRACSDPGECWSVLTQSDVSTHVKYVYFEGIYLCSTGSHPFLLGISPAALSVWSDSWHIFVSCCLVKVLFLGCTKPGDFFFFPFDSIYWERNGKVRSILGVLRVETQGQDCNKRTWNSKNRNKNPTTKQTTKTKVMCPVSTVLMFGSMFPVPSAHLSSPFMHISEPQPRR